MNDFFTFYSDITQPHIMFQAFSFAHMAFLIIIACLILRLYHYYETLSMKQQRHFQIGMAIYFLVEEMLYTAWLFLVCHDNVWLQVVPLELCSICVYMNALCVFLQKDFLRFFSGVIGLLAGVVAMIYPANISNLYPVLSYRVINFYILHGAFVLFAFIQLRDEKLLQYHYIRLNFVILMVMFTSAFLFNSRFHTQYMFVGTPPSIGVLKILYNTFGYWLFMPIIGVLLFVMQFLVLYLLRILQRYYYNISTQSIRK